MSRKKVVYLNFEEVFLRITKETSLKNVVQLADFLEISQSAISQKKKEKNFPIEWVYRISKEFNLSLDWLTEGKRNLLGSETIRPERGDTLLDEIEEWINREKIKEPKFVDWFEVEFKQKFPQFAEWKRKADSEREDSLAQKANVA